jgi:hypothetical protein
MKTTKRFYCVLAFAALLIHTQARANVYATNIRVNGGTNNVSLVAGTDTVGISFILNEDAALVMYQFKSGTNGSSGIYPQGLPRGSNYITWSANAGYNTYLPPGDYTFSITAVAKSPSTWKQITSTNDSGTYVWEPRGLAVNKNTNSFFYGRVFTGNATANSNPTKPGDNVGIIKANADGSFADEGAFSTGGYAWAGDLFSPWKMEVGDDDILYVNDWTGNGNVIGFDQTLTAPYLSVLRDDNNPTGSANMTGPFVTHSAQGTQVWMADINYLTPAPTGIRRWTVTSDGTIAQNDPGTEIVHATGGSDLNLYPYDVAVDKNGYIYTIQYRLNTGDTANRLMRFAPYNESGNPEYFADWKVGAGNDSMRGAFACAVDPTATYVAIAFRTGGGGSGGIGIYSATNGALIKRDLVPLDDYREVAWDNVGNLYVANNLRSTWNAFSPPARRPPSACQQWSAATFNSPSTGRLTKCICSKALPTS